MAEDVDPPEVKGAVLTGVLRYAQAAGPLNAIDAILDDSPVASAVMREKVDKRGWYPIRVFERLLEATVKLIHLYDPNGFIEFGRWAARHDIGNYKLDSMAMDDPLQLIHCSDFVWKQNYRNAGDVLVNGIEAQAAQTEIRFPLMAHCHCLLMEGWADEFSRVMLPDFRIKTVLSACRHRGAESAVYRTDWAHKSDPVPIARIQTEKKYQEG